MFTTGTQVLLCLATIVLWGLSPIMTRLYTNIVGIRVYLIANAIMQGAATCTINTVMHTGVWGETWQVMFREAEWKRWVLLITNAVLCLSTPFVIYNTLLSNTDSIAIIVTTTWYGAPILTSILGVWVFGQKLTWLQVGGIVVSVGGIVMMNIESIISDFKKKNEEETASLIGN